MKNLLANIETLTYYDPTKPIIISCNASPYGLGVSSYFVDGIENPVMSVSSTLPDMKHADGLSPLPLNVPTDVEQDSTNNVCFSSFPLKFDDVALVMQNDRILTEALRAI